MVMGVGPLGVIEAEDIGQQTLLELPDSLEAARSSSSFFKYLKKHSITALSYGWPLAEKDWTIPSSSMTLQKSPEVNCEPRSV